MGDEHLSSRFPKVLSPAALNLRVVIIRKMLCCTLQNLVCELLLKCGVKHWVGEKIIKRTLYLPDWYWLFGYVST